MFSQFTARLCEEFPAVHFGFGLSFPARGISHRFKTFHRFVLSESDFWGEIVACLTSPNNFGAAFQLWVSSVSFIFCLYRFLYYSFFRIGSSNVNSVAGLHSQIGSMGKGKHLPQCFCVRFSVAFLFL